MPLTSETIDMIDARLCEAKYRGSATVQISRYALEGLVDEIERLKGIIRARAGRQHLEAMGVVE